MKTGTTWWQDISDKRVLAVSLAIAFSQGLNALNDLPISYLYKDDFQFSPAQVSALSSFVTIPWILKPCWGIISDNVPFSGYKRKSYVILLGFLGCLAHLCLASWSQVIFFTVLIIAFISFALAFCNVIGEALLVESAQRFGAQSGKSEVEKQNQASQNVSLFFGVKHIGSIIASYMGGFLLEYLTKNKVFQISSIVPLFVAIIALTLPESKVHSQHKLEASVDLALEEESTQLFASRESRKESSPFTRIWGFVKQPEIYKPLIFLFIFQITPSGGSAMFYFYTNELKFAPEFMGRIKLAGSIATILGIFLYNRYLKDIHFKKILLWSSLVCFVLSLSQIILITRANIALGIPDKLFCLGDSVIITVFGEINFLPILILACRLCPKNIEGTMYALFLSIFNFGGMVSTQLGALLIWILGIDQNNFANLWMMVVISSVFLLLPLPWLTRIEFDAAIRKTEEKHHICIDDDGDKTCADIEFQETTIKSS